MTDVVLYARSRDRKVLIVANTPIGRKWMEENFILDSSVSVLVDADGIEETIAKLQESELSYDY